MASVVDESLRHGAPAMFMIRMHNWNRVGQVAVQGYYWRLDIRIIDVG